MFRQKQRSLADVVRKMDDASIQRNLSVVYGQALHEGFYALWEQTTDSYHADSFCCMDLGIVEPFVESDRDRIKYYAYLVLNHCEAV